MRNDAFSSIKSLEERSYTCPYCQNKIKDMNRFWVPGAADDAGWEMLAKLHARKEVVIRLDGSEKEYITQCEWVKTRGFQIAR